MGSCSIDTARDRSQGFGISGRDIVSADSTLTADRSVLNRLPPLYLCSYCTRTHGLYQVDSYIA
jgi:hypothetical protein